ncbi:hypothetical protein [Sphingomonas sp. BK069]|uniref:hypothetical protein n=1 Tax=Sphingomonas sp. BK069 TaxID=2586979 RepID=UPI001622C0C0|nr:hypothetical protein [Sphingomonas sp. BK069]MBB3349804.1 hypothetical protein [Sphingomonas sp. BK069]
MLMILTASRRAAYRLAPSRSKRPSAPDLEREAEAAAAESGLKLEKAPGELRAL